MLTWKWVIREFSLGQKMANAIQPLWDRHDYDRDGRRVKLACFEARSWLVSIILVELLLILGWLTKEYFFFDYRCLTKGPNAPGQENLHYLINTVQRRAIPSLEIKTLPDENPDLANFSIKDYPNKEILSFLVDLNIVPHAHHKRSVVQNAPTLLSSETPTTRHKLRKKRPVESVVRIEKLPVTSGNKSIRTKTTRTRLTTNSSKIHKKQYGRNKIFGCSETIRMTPDTFTDEDEYEETNGNLVKRYHLLGGSPNTRKSFSSKENEENEHRSNWLHGVIDPDDPSFTNQGQIRVYPMQVAYERPQPDADYIKRLLNLTETTASMTLTSTGEVTTTIAITARGSIGIQNQEHGATPEQNTIHLTRATKSYEIDYPNAVETTTTSTTTETLRLDTTSVPVSTNTEGFMSTKIPKLPSSTPKVEVFFDEELIYMDAEKDRSTSTSTTGYERPSYIPRLSIPSFVVETEKMDFVRQLDAFTSGAMCIMRTVLILWCFAQCLSAMPFVLGIFLRLRCCLILHLILDALFLVVLFILSVTITVFSVILYGLVDEMTSYELQEWIAFSLILVAVLISYTIVFMITLKCAELMMNENSKPHDPHRDVIYEPLDTLQPV